jgi:hypothetical protein
MVSIVKHGLNDLKKFRSPGVLSSTGNRAAPKKCEIATDAGQDHFDPGKD